MNVVWSEGFILGALLCLSLCALLRINKELRGKRGALSVHLNLSDITILTSVSGLYALTLSVGPVWASVAVGLGIFMYGLLVFIDAMLFVQYRIEVNRQTLAWFFRGAKGLQKGIPHLLSVLRNFPTGALIPVLLALVLAFPFLQMNIIGQASVAVCFLLISITACNERSYVDYTLCFLATAILGLLVLYDTDVSHFWLAISVVLLIALVILLVLLRTFGYAPTAFMNTPTLLTNMLADDEFKADNTVNLSPLHQSFVTPSASLPKASSLHGALKGANIILITFESLGAYVSPYTRAGARSLLAERVQKHAWVSNQHYCLCPNTTVSTNQIYTGAYSNNPYNKDDSPYPGVEPKHIKQLKQEGYKTLFLDSADIGLYDYHKLLKRIGFDKVWGTKDLPQKGLTADYRLWNMVDAVVDEVSDNPFFLHIINDQTHMPYEVVDKQRFNRHKGTGSKDLYLNAVEEVDYILDEFLKRLGEKLDLSNTILVFTGDHGESFGEFGYSFHSNSVIKPQMHVPFILHHPKLGHKEIAHSCHFDLFPTFFDLLGIDYDYPSLGQSLAFDDRPFAYFFHSATLKGNTPANFGFMLDGDMYWMDRLFNQVNILTSDEARLAPRKYGKSYIQTLLFRMLQERKILT